MIKRTEQLNERLNASAARRLGAPAPRSLAVRIDDAFAPYPDISLSAVGGPNRFCLLAELFGAKASNLIKLAQPPVISPQNTSESTNIDELNGCVIC